MPGGSSGMDLPRLEGATASASDVATLLQSHGAVVIDNLVDPTEMDQLRSDMNHCDGVFYGAPGSFAGAHSARNAGKPLGESRVARDLAEHPLVVDAVRLRLKPWCRRIVLGTCTNINIEPPPDPHTPPAPAQVLHRDEGMWGASDWNTWIPSTTERPEFSISVMWAISNFTTENGATRVIPRSHLWERDKKKMDHQSPAAVFAIIDDGEVDDLAAEGSGYSKHRDNLEKLEALCVPATMTKGSVLLWSGATIHGAGAHSPCPDDANFNRDLAIRRGLIFIYNLGWLRSEHNLHFALPPEVISKFPISLQELMGIVGSNKVNHPWYSGPVYAQPLLGSAEDDDPLSVNSTTTFTNKADSE